MFIRSCIAFLLTTPCIQSSVYTTFVAPEKAASFLKSTKRRDKSFIKQKTTNFIQNYMPTWAGDNALFKGIVRAARRNSLEGFYTIIDKRSKKR